MKKVLILSLTLGSLAACARNMGESAGKTVSSIEFLQGAHDGKTVSLEAVVSDVLHDETDPRFLFFVLDSDGETIYAPMKTGEDEPSSHAQRFLGARIRATGVCDAYVPPSRRQMGRQLYLSGFDNITVIVPAPKNSFDVPEIGNTNLMTPSEISRLGHRRSKGKILASWSSGESLLKTPDGRIMHVSFAEKHAPKTGSCVEVVGRPVSNVYRVNLERARWRTTDAFNVTECAITNVTARDIMTDNFGRRHVKPQFFGRTITIRGTVNNRVESNGETILTVEDEAFTFAIHASKTDAKIGSVIEVTGVCILDIENWRPNAAFPQIKGFFVVTRDENDIKILSHPPWWTTGKLFAIIGLLLTAIGGVLAWNIALRKLAERRGRTLLKVHIRQVKAELKIAERTRLAAELHDSLAQTLTGVSLEISAAKKMLHPDAPTAAISHLDFAAHAISSSREELRNCIWDLHCEALDEPNIEKAIEFSIRPHINDAAISIRLNVPRTKLSDALAHAMLRIIRELTINAIRHSGAKAIKIAGCIDGNTLKFSVSDDGSGFEPESAPGINQGHFGLQGVRERVDAFNGTVTIESSIGCGTRVSVSMSLMEGKDEDCG